MKDRQIHMNLYAVQGMLARVYWMKGDLKTAEEYFSAAKVAGLTEQADTNLKELKKKQNYPVK